MMKMRRLQCRRRLRPCLERDLVLLRRLQEVIAKQRGFLLDPDLVIYVESMRLMENPLLRLALLVLLLLCRSVEVADRGLLGTAVRLLCKLLRRAVMRIVCRARSRINRENGVVVILMKGPHIATAKLMLLR